MRTTLANSAKVLLAVPAFLFLACYIQATSLPNRARYRAKAALLRAKRVWGMVGRVRREGAEAAGGRRSWFIWCGNCHRRFGMAVQKGGMVEIRTGSSQKGLRLDEGMAAQVSLKCRHCGKPVAVMGGKPVAVMRA